MMKLRVELLVAVGSISILFLAVWYEFPPFKQIMEQGALMKASQAGSTLESAYEVYTLGSRALGRPIRLDIQKGIHFWNPQVAVWIEDTTGRYVETVFVTNSTGKGLFFSGRTAENFKEFDDAKRDFNPAQDYRVVDALPYWSHKRGIESMPGVYAPSRDKPLPDGISSATPKASFIINSAVDPALVKFNVMAEFNVAFDENEYYSEYDFPDDSLYHGGTGLLGQPSIIYKASVDVSSGMQVYLMKLLGHGHHSGQSGELFEDMTTITTANNIIDRILVEVK